MVKCPKCSKELPDGTAFCLNCFSPLRSVAAATPQSTKNNRLLGILKSRQMKITLSCLLIAALFSAGAVILKKNLHKPETVAAQSTSFVTVTNSNGEIVTNRNGEAATQAVAEVTDENGEAVTNEDGSKVYRAVVPVTNASGESVTNKSGEQIFEVVTTQSPSKTNGSTEPTSKNGLFGWLFDNQKTTTNQTDSATSETERNTEDSTTVLTTLSTTNETSTASTTATAQPSTSSTTEPTTQSTTTSTTLEKDSGDYTYRELNGKIFIVSYNGKATEHDIIVPAYIDGKEVTYIGAGAFKKNMNIFSITFESAASGSGRKLIFQEGEVFYLSNLRKIKLADETSNCTLNASGTAVNNNTDTSSLSVFSEIFGSSVNLHEITIDVTRNISDSDGYLAVINNCIYYNNCFVMCPPNYQKYFYQFKNGTTGIADYAFNRCPLLSRIYLPSSIKNVSYKAFSNAKGLKTIEVDSGNPYFSAYNGVLMSKTQNNMICYPKAKTDTEFVFPDDYASYTFDLQAFCANPYLTTLTLPKCKVINTANTTDYKPTKLVTVRLSKSDPNLSGNKDILSKYYSVETY